LAETLLSWFIVHPQAVAYSLPGQTEERGNCVFFAQMMYYFVARKYTIWYNNNNDRLTAFDPGQPG